jgi:hypothetical protein
MPGSTLYVCGRKRKKSSTGFHTRDEESAGKALSSLFDPAEIDKKSIRFREGPRVILPAIEEAVARAVVADQLAGAAAAFHLALEGNGSGIGNGGIRRAMEDQGRRGVLAVVMRQ